MEKMEHIPHPFELFGVECGKGWYKLIEPIFEYIKNYNKDKKDNEKIVVLQVKEKFGTLRIYVSYGTDELYELIDKAEEESSKVCELCGSRENVGTRLSGWITTMCLDCLKKEVKERGYPQMWERNSDDKRLWINPDGTMEEVTEKLP